MTTNNLHKNILPLIVSLCYLALSQFSTSCRNGNEPLDKQIHILEPLTFSISNDAENQRYVLKINKKGNVDIVCTQLHHNDTIHSTLTIKQSECLNAVIYEYFRKYYRMFLVSDLYNIPNGKTGFTNHRYEYFSVNDFNVMSNKVPAIIYMNFGNRMCYVVKEDEFFNNKSGMAPYLDLNKFVFNLLCDKLRENGISNKYTEMKWPTKID